ncbi:MAG: DMT family transporter, partial [Pseudomonadota bacterium]
VSNARLPRDPATWVHLVVVGVLIQWCFPAGVFYSISTGVDAGITALITGVQPILTALIVGPLLGERLNRTQWLGFFVGFIGLTMVVGQTFALGRMPLPGLVASVVALLGITFGTLYQKRFVADFDFRSGSFIQFVAAFITYSGFALVFETREVEWNPTFALALAWLCLALSFGAISLLWLLLRQGEASKVASLFYLIPAVAAFEAYALFDETFVGIQMAGIVITALGVYFVNRGDALGAKSALSQR